MALVAVKDDDGGDAIWHFIDIGLKDMLNPINNAALVQPVCPGWHKSHQQDLMETYAPFCLLLFLEEVQK